MSKSVRDLDREIPETPSWPEDAPDTHRVLSAGVCSRVFDSDQEEIGHVLMVEYDNTTRWQPRQDARDLPGLSVVLRSSPGSYHLWDLGVRSWDRQIELAEGTECCRTHLSEMIEQGRSVLRTQPKLYADDRSVYKSAPVPVYVYDSMDDSPISAPHATRLAQLAERAGQTTERLLIDSRREYAPTAGETFSQSYYETMTDELRSRWIPGGETDG